MARSWANLAQFRERVRAVAELIAREEGLGDVCVCVDVATDVGRAVRIEVVERLDVDGTDLRWDAVRGRRWEDN